MIYFLRFIFFIIVFYFVTCSLRNNLWKYYEDCIIYHGQKYWFSTYLFYFDWIEFIELYSVIDTKKKTSILLRLVYISLYKWLGINDKLHIRNFHPIYLQYILLNSNLPITFLLLKVLLLTQNTLSYFDDTSNSFRSVVRIFLGNWVSSILRNIVYNRSKYLC